MKRIILALSCLAAVICLCACGGSGGRQEAKPVPTIEPSELITEQDVADIAGYTPVTDQSGTTRDGNKSSVLYRSEPVGEHDIVELKLIQFNDDMGYQQIFNYYEQQKALRNDVQMVESLGQEAYIAYPTIHVYDRGCLMEITAGSGAGEEQKTLLTRFALTAAGRLEEIVPEYKAE